MRIVVDTNVVVSGLLKPFSASGEILRLVASGGVGLCFDARILWEYRQVLLRPKFGFDPEEVGNLLVFIETSGEPVSCRPLAKRLPHGEDEPFLEAAIAGGVPCLVTGNLRHFPAAAMQGVRAASPAEFIGIYRRAAADKPTR